MRRLRWSTVGALVATTACTGVIGDGARGSAPGSDVAPPAGPASAPCIEGVVDVGPTPLRMLTRLEYDNTIRDLLGDPSAPAAAFVPDEPVAGFAANAVAPISQAQLEQTLAAAEAVAERAVASKPDALVGCDATQTSCVRGFIEQFGKRAFRGPVEQETADDLVALYEDARDAWGAGEAVRLVLAAILVSPRFLYHVELGAEPTAAVSPLTSFEIAARLSYFLWQSAPDEALIAAAESGTLDVPKGIEAEARRLLADDRARSAVASFHDQWLQVAHLGDVAKDPSAFPTWTADLAHAMRAETLIFADEVVRKGDGRLATLLTASYSYLTPELGAHYGALGPSEAGFAKVALDPSERAGVLTHASLLAGHAHASVSSWVHRGKFVREQLLCQTLPPPPPNVDMSVLNDPNRLTNPACSGCHGLMDPIGKGFDGYDPIGRFVGAGAPGEILDPGGGLDVAGPFEGVVELAHALAESDAARRCVARQWLRFAVRRADTAADACSLERAATAFADSGHDVRELLVALTGLDAFRFRRAVSE
jgi:hypothetical protein